MLARQLQSMHLSRSDSFLREKVPLSHASFGDWVLPLKSVFPKQIDRLAVKRLLASGCEVGSLMPVLARQASPEARCLAGAGRAAPRIETARSLGLQDASAAARVDLLGLVHFLVNEEAARWLCVLGTRNGRRGATTCADVDQSGVTSPRNGQNSPFCPSLVAPNPQASRILSSQNPHRVF